MVDNELVTVFMRFKPDQYHFGWRYKPGINYVTLEVYKAIRFNLLKCYNECYLSEIQLIKPKFESPY